MKQLPKQKWILSAVLVAALGSQYYFSASSKNIGEVDMSSLAVTLTEQQLQSLTDITSAIQAAKRSGDSTVAVSADLTRVVRASSADVTVARPASADPSRPASADATRPATAAVTQAVAPAPCADCVVLSKAEAERIRQILTEVTGKKEKKKDEVVVAETAAEKRRREREEREEKKRDEAEAKAEKLRDEKLARHEQFAEKAEDMAYKCDGDVSCLASGYSSLLLRYSGKKKLDLSVVQAAYRKHIDAAFKAAVSDPDKREAAIEAINSITRDIPTEYRAVKETALSSVKTVLSERAISAQKNFKLSEQLSKANKISESLSVGQQAEQEAQEFTQMGQFYTSAINTSLKDVGDSVTQLYMKNTFSPELNKLFMNMRLTGSTTTINPDGTVSTDNNNGHGSRNARGSNPTVAQQPSVTNNNGTQSGNIQFGSPQQGSRSGGRGSY